MADSGFWEGVGESFSMGVCNASGWGSCAGAASAIDGEGRVLRMDVSGEGRGGKCESGLRGLVWGWG